MTEPIIVVPYDPNWKREFEDIGIRVRKALGDIAIRIDHIGSTSVVGLDAKPVIDIQISVSALEPMTYKPLLANIGYFHRIDNPDKTKRYFREDHGQRRTHIHVRELGSWAEQFALLFRDYLREHPAACSEYAKVKYELMERFRNQREAYVDQKNPIIWKIMRMASQWSQEMGWKPGKTDV